MNKSQNYPLVEFSVVMPCLNEEKTLSTCINKARSFFENAKISYEIIVADNGSTDGSIEIAINSGVKLVNITEKGYGNALKKGIGASSGLYIIMGDSDDSYDFSKLTHFVEKLRSGFELVMGNRFKGGIRQGAMPWHHKYIGNPFLSFVGRILFNNNIGDFHCGLRGFTKDMYIRINPVSEGMEFASELVVKAALTHIKMCEVPVILYPDGRNRKPHLRSWSDGYRHLKLLISVYLNKQKYAILS